MDIDLELIRKHLKAAPHDIRVLAKATSTNAALRDLAKAGAPEGTAVIAESRPPATDGSGNRGSRRPA